MALSKAVHREVVRTIKNELVEAWQSGPRYHNSADRAATRVEGMLRLLQAIYGIEKMQELRGEATNKALEECPGMRC